MMYVNGSAKGGVATLVLPNAPSSFMNGVRSPVR